MILKLTDPIDNREIYYPLRTVEDFEKLAQEFPQVDRIAMWAPTLNEAAYGVFNYLNRHPHYLVKLIEDDPMRKSLKNKVAGVAVAAACSLSTPPSQPQAISNCPLPQETIESNRNKFGTKDEDKFLWNLMQIESSGGKNTNHPTITWDSPMKGQKAMGKWGLLKPTVDEMVRRQELEGNTKLSHLKDLDNSALSEHLSKNPNVELGLARYMAKFVLNRTKGNEHKAAYSWLNGHNLDPKSITSNLLKDSDYVNKYKIFDHMNPLKKEKKISKAEVAKVPYDEKLKMWFKYREDLDNKPLPRDSTFVPDLGDKREKEDEAVVPESGDTKDRIKAAIESAKRGVMR